MSIEPDTLVSLSRLLDGELPPDQAADLRARIAAEPELAAAWERMQALPGALAGLPDTAPPPELDTRVLADRPRATRPWPTIAGLVAVVAMAASLLLLIRGAQPDIVLVEGEQWIHGEAHVLAGDVPVKIDGLARILVEPPAGAARVKGQEVEPMNWKHAAAAATGAVITVAVYEGHAQVGHDGDTTIEAGEHWTRGAPETTGAPHRRVVTHIDDGVPDPGDDPDALRARIDELEQTLATHELEDAIQRGRIAAVEGVPQDWPDNLPPQLAADGFERSLRDSLAGEEDLDILEINCDEYPCYAIIETDPQSLGPGQKPGGGALQAWAEGVDGEVGLWNLASVTGSSEGEIALLGTSLIAEGDDNDDDLSTRLRYRIEGSVKGWVDDLSAPEDEE